MSAHRIAIVGAGAFGFALSIHLDRSHGEAVETRLYDDDSHLIDLLARGEPHPRIAGDLRLPATATVLADLDAAVEQADLVILAVPGQAVPSVATDLAGRIPAEVPFLNVSKALEKDAGRRIGEIVADVRGTEAPYATLAGGMIAAELARGRRLGATLAMHHRPQAEELARIMQGPGLYVEASDDVPGVEYAAALKSVLVIGIGVLEGLGSVFGTLTLCLSLASEEAQALAIALGAKPATFSMLSQCWGNDLLLSAFGSTRNRAFGVAVSEALRDSDERRERSRAGRMSPAECKQERRALIIAARQELESARGTVEGVHTATVLPRLAARAGIEIPRLRAVVDLLDGELEVQEAAARMLA